MITVNEKLVIAGDLEHGYCVYYLVFNWNLTECTPYRYSKLVHKSEVDANNEMVNALAKRAA